MAYGGNSFGMAYGGFYGKGQGQGQARTQGGQQPEDLIDDLKRALVQAGAVKVSLDGIEPLSLADGESAAAPSSSA